MKDILITDKGNNVAEVTAQTEKAKKHFKHLKLPSPFEIVSTEATNILAWAISHNFTIESEVPMLIQSKK